MKLEFKVGDLVGWSGDGDIGIITEIDPDCDPWDATEPYYIQWFKEPTASGWHTLDDYLILLNSV